MKTRIIYILATVILLGSGTVHAEEVIIDFEQLGALGDGGFLGTSTYSEDDFTLTTTEEFGYAIAYGSQHIAMYIGINNGTVEMTKDDGGIFDLTSIDFGYGDGQSITVTGIKENFSSINEFITLDIVGFETYNFDGFTNLISVNWDIGSYVLFDNITIIPEPGSFYLFAFGSMTALRKNII